MAQEQAVSRGTHSTSGHRARMSGRALAVFGVSFSFLVMLISGLLLYVSPKGRVAQQINWELLGLGRDGWEGLHIAVSLLFAGFVLWHFLVHLRVYKTLLGGTPVHPRGHRNEAWIALVVLIFIGAGALLAWPPSSWMIDGNEYFKQTYWDPTAGAAGHDH